MGENANIILRIVLERKTCRCCFTASLAANHPHVRGRARQIVQFAAQPFLTLSEVDRESQRMDTRGDIEHQLLFRFNWVAVQPDASPFPELSRSLTLPGEDASSWH